MKIKHLLNALAFCGVLSAPVAAQNLSADDLGFALGAKPEVEFMTKQEMVETEGERAGWVIHGYFDRHGNYRRYTPPPPPPPPPASRNTWKGINIGSPRLPEPGW